MRLDGWGLLALAVAGWVWARQAGGPFPHLFAYAAAAPLVLGALWTWAARRAVAARLEPERPWGTVGETLGVRVWLRHRGRLPVAVTVALGAPAGAGPDPGGPRRLWLPPGSARAVAFVLPLRRRGTLRLGPAAVAVSDPAGVCRARVPAGEAVSIRVYPRLYPPGAVLARLRRLAGPGRVAPPEAEAVPAGVRPWREGDDPRRVDWKATARRGRLHVREPEPPAADRVLIALDLDGDGAAGERLVALAASLARDLVTAGAAVGLAAGGAAPVWLPPERGPRGGWRLLEALADVAPGPVPLREVLRAARGSLPVAWTVVLCHRPDPALTALWAGGGWGRITLVCADPTAPGSVPGGDRLPAAAIEPGEAGAP